MATLKDVVDHIGYPDPLEQWVFEFYQRMSQDVMIGFFFTGRDLRAVAHRQTLFIARSAGYSVLEFLRTPQAAHAELPPIHLGFFNRRIVMLSEFLTHKGLSPSLTEAWVRFESSFRDAIVHRVNS